MSRSCKVALLQLAAGRDIAVNVERTVAKVREAARGGAKVICLQELFNARYFPQNVSVHAYALAEQLPSETTRAMQALAEELQVALIVPVFEEARPGIYFNSAVVYDADGSYLGKYRKTHIPDSPQYHEKFYFTPGDLGYPVFETKFGVIAVGICWDEWFPEVARIFALKGAEIIFYPSAIGSEPDRPDYSSAEAWKTVLRAHGIANGVFVAAVNRVGVEDDMRFYGESFVSDPFGDFISSAGADEQILFADIDFAKIRDLRELLHFLRDRRVDTYEPMLCRVIESSE